MIPKTNPMTPDEVMELNLIEDYFDEESDTTYEYSDADAHVMLDTM
jgi:hypothetical protein